MSVVAYFVETAEGYLDTAAETQFGAVATTVGTLLVLGTTLVVILVFINMIYQYRAMDGRTAFWLAVKVGLIGVFAANWVQFNALASAILNGIDSIAGALVASVGGGSPGPSGTFAEEFDELIAALGDYLNAAGSELNWMAGALLDTLGVLLLSILGGLAAFIVVASRLMIALLIGIAPVMIFLTLFEVTKDYFARWLSALISFAMYRRRRSVRDDHGGLSGASCRAWRPGGSLEHRRPYPIFHDGADGKGFHHSNTFLGSGDFRKHHDASTLGRVRGKLCLRQRACR